MQFVVRRPKGNTVFSVHGSYESPGKSSQMLLKMVNSHSTCVVWLGCAIWDQNTTAKFCMDFSVQKYKSIWACPPVGVSDEKDETRDQPKTWTRWVTDMLMIICMCVWDMPKSSASKSDPLANIGEMAFCTAFTNRCFGAYELDYAWSWYGRDVEFNFESISIITFSSKFYH